MADLGSIRYAPVPSGGEDFRGLAQGLEQASSLIQNLRTDKVVGEGLDATKDAVTDVLSDAQDSSIDESQIKSASALGSQEFADQYSRLRRDIVNSSGSVRARLILEAKRAIQGQIDSHPAFRKQLVQEFNAFISTSPELQQAAAMDAARAEDTFAQDYLTRVEDNTYREWGQGGLGIPEDVVLGTVEWADLYKAQLSKRARFDGLLQETAMLQAQGALDGPKLAARVMEMLHGDSGVVQGMLGDLSNKANAVRTNRVEGKLVPEDQEQWTEVTKPALLAEIDKGIVNLGNSFNQLVQDNPNVLRDQTSMNFLETQINNAQSDLITYRDALANDNFDIVAAQKAHMFAKGRRILGKAPLLNNMANVMAVEGGLFTALKDAGLTNALKSLQVSVEGDVADAGTALFGAMMETSGDGATTEASTPEEYNKARKEAKSNVRTDVSPTAKVTVRRAKGNLDNLARTLTALDDSELTPLLIKESFTAFGGEVEKLNATKASIFDGGDKDKIRTTFASPQYTRLFLAAVKQDIPGLTREASEYETYWRQTSDDDDLDSFEAWHSEIAQQASADVKQLPYIDNILDLARPVPFDVVQNSGEVVISIIPQRVKAAVEQYYKEKGFNPKGIPAETQNAMGFVTKQAAQLGAEMTKLLRTRHNRNILVNRQQTSDYLDAYFDPFFGLDLIIPLDEDIVSK